MNMLKTPKPYPVKHRPGMWAAKGQDPVTLSRKTFYARSAEEASAKAFASFGIYDDYRLASYFANHYLPIVKNRSRNWLDQISWAMDLHVLPKLGHRDIQEIRRSELQLFFNGLVRKLSPTSIGKIRDIVNAIFRLAVDDGVITVNPATRISLPKAPKVQKDVLTFEELRKLLDVAGPLSRPFVLLAGCSGLRLGEALGVTWEAVDENGVLRVKQQVQQYQGGCVVTPKLKTDHSYRDIPLPASLVEELRSCRQASKTWVCSDTKGGYIKPKNVTRELKIACEKAGVKVVSPHDLRHTFISLMDNEVQAPRMVTMAIVGHSGKTMTDAYSHVTNQQIFEWLDRYMKQMSTASSPKLETTITKTPGSN